MSKHLYDTAIFFADKVVTLSRGAMADVYLLAQARATAHLGRAACEARQS